MVVQPWVATPGHPGAPTEALLLRTRPYTVSPVTLLQVCTTPDNHLRLASYIYVVLPSPDAYPRLEADLSVFHVFAVKGR